MKKRVVPSGTGNMGRVCISHPDHGETYVLRGGREWCPSSEHAASATAKATPTFLDAQQKALDDLAAGPVTA